MRTLRGRLFVILTAATGFVWLCAAAWTYAVSEREVERVLDARLQEAAHMVDAVFPRPEDLQSDAGKRLQERAPAAFQQQLPCQIWSFDGRLIGQSHSAPAERLADRGSGFAERVVDGEPWRIFSIEDPEKGLQITVGDRIGRRDALVAHLIFGLLGPMILILPLLAALIWLSLVRGLGPLAALAAHISVRAADDVTPVEAGFAPREVLPLIAALNSLLVRVEAARRHERDLTAFAAHELRTPLAGLRAQAQIAMGAGDPKVRQHALAQIIFAVDRTSRLIRQLLAMAKLEATPDCGPLEAVALGELLRDAIRDVASPRPNVSTEIDPSVEAAEALVDREALTLALRNLHENAVLHMAEGGVVRWSARREAGGTLRLVVEDEGPGIPDDEIRSVTRRFFRGRHKSSIGSGLGLAIVERALERCGASLTLANRTDRRGLRVEVEMRATPARAQPAAAPTPRSAARTH